MPYSSKQEINKLVENLGQFGMFKVTTDKGIEFMTTEIVSNMGVFLEFRRLFASSVYTDNAVIGIKYVSKTVAICKTSTTTYTIKAVYGRKEPIDRGRRKFNQVEDLMDLQYVDDNFNMYFPELDLLILPIHPALLGKLTITEQAQIKRIINVYLYGKEQSMQMCRTVCFQVRLHDDRNRIYAGIFDLERGCSITSRQIFEEYMSVDMPDDILARHRAFQNHAKEFMKNLGKFENKA